MACLDDFLPAIDVLGRVPDDIWIIILSQASRWGELPLESGTQDAFTAAKTAARGVRKTQLALLKVCRRWESIVQPHLFDCLQFKNAKQLNSFWNNPFASKLHQEILQQRTRIILCDLRRAQGADAAPVDTIINVLSRAQRLQYLLISTPGNALWAEAFSRIPLPSLTHLAIKLDTFQTDAEHIQSLNKLINLRWLQLEVAPSDTFGEALWEEGLVPETRLSLPRLTCLSVFADCSWDRDYAVCRFPLDVAAHAELPSLSHVHLTIHGLHADLESGARQVQPFGTHLTHLYLVAPTGEILESLEEIAPNLVLLQFKLSVLRLRGGGQYNLTLRHSRLRSLCLYFVHCMQRMVERLSPDVLPCLESVQLHHLTWENHHCQAFYSLQWAEGLVDDGVSVRDDAGTAFNKGHHMGFRWLSALM